MEAILTASGVTYLNGGDANITVKAVPAVDAVITTAWDGVAAMATQSGATFYDTPDGTVVFEDYGNRGQTTLSWHLVTPDHHVGEHPRNVGEYRPRAQRHNH